MSVKKERLEELLLCDWGCPELQVSMIKVAKQNTFCNNIKVGKLSLLVDVMTRELSQGLWNYFGNQKLNWNYYISKLLDFNFPIYDDLLLETNDLFMGEIGINFNGVDISARDYINQAIRENNLMHQTDYPDLSDY